MSGATVIQALQDPTIALAVMVTVSQLLSPDYILSKPMIYVMMNRIH